MFALKETQPKSLRQNLGLWSAIAINIGAIIGGGIFVVTGIVAGLAGSALVISIIVAASIAFLTALSFTRLSAWQPIEGSGYEYVRQLISPSAGFLSGWMWIIANTFGGAAVSLGFAYIIAEAIPGVPVKIVAAAMCIAFSTLNFIGIRQSALINNALVVIKIVILGFFIIFGATHVATSNLEPFEPFSSGVLFGAYFIFFAFGGFARATIIAEEVKDPKRNVPKAVLLSLVISTLVYVLVGLVAVGLVGAGNLATSYSPLVFAIGATGSSAAVRIVSIGGMVATASVLLTSILGVSRMVFSMARRGDLPQALSRINKKFGTPHVSIWVIGLAMTFLVLFFDLTGILVVSTFALLFWYTLVNAAALKLEQKKSVRRKLLPVLGIGTCLALLVAVLFVEPVAWTAGVTCLLIGAILYMLRMISGRTQS